VSPKEFLLTLQRLKSKVVRSKDAPLLDDSGGTGSRQPGGMQQQQNQQQHRQQQQQQRGLPPHLRGAGGGGISGNGRPSSRGAFQGGPRPGMRPGSGAPMHGGVQQQGGFPGSMHSSGMPGSMAGGPHGGGIGSGGGISGWAGMNPAAARAMLLAQQQGQPWGNEQLPLFQDLPTGACCIPTTVSVSSDLMRNLQTCNLLPCTVLLHTAPALHPSRC
jgi:hypothetical protein